MNALLDILVETSNQPALPQSIAWIRPMLIIICIMFLLAMIAGPIVRARSPREIPLRHTGEPGVREDPPHHP